MSVGIALILGVEIGVLVFCTAVAVDWHVSDRASRRNAKAAVHQGAADRFYLSFLAYRVVALRAAPVPLGFEPMYMGSRAWEERA